MVQSEEDVRLERIVARLREPPRDTELPQSRSAEAACSASQVSRVYYRHLQRCYLILAPASKAQPILSV